MLFTAICDDLWVGSIEIALKHKICKTLNWAGFPSSNREFDNYRSLKTHDLDILLSFTGIDRYYMKELLEKIKKIEKETSAEKGNYDLFALFSREESPGKWDIHVAASWINGNTEAALKYLAPKIQQSFTQNELLQISRIVIIEENNPELPAIQHDINIEHSISEIKDATFFGLQIKHAIFITSRSRKAA